MTTYNSQYEDTSPFSDTTGTIALNSGVVGTYTVPGANTTRYRIDFKYPYNANVYVGLNTTPVTPSPGTVNSTNSVEFRPERKYVKGGDVLSFISSSTVTDGGFSLLQLPN